MNNNNIIKLSFDQYQRYKKTQEIIEILRDGDELFKILEVGPGGNKNLSLFLPKDKIIYLDSNVPKYYKEDPYFIEGNATNMPFVDNSYDYIIALDVYEHIIPDKREQFLNELCRCSRYGFILANPFKDKDIVESEISANEHFKLLYGKDHPWLEEHIKNGLPNLEWTLNLLEDKGFKYCTFQHGSLYLWKKLIKINFTSIESTKIYEQSLSIDSYYNSVLYKKDFEKPCYRTFIIALGKDNNKVKRLKAQINSWSFEKGYTLNEIKKLNELEESFYNSSFVEYKNMLNILKNEMVFKESQLNQKKEESNKIMVELAEKENQLIQKTQELGRLKENLKSRENQLELILNSFPWKVTKSLRRFKKIIKMVGSLNKLIIRRKYKPELEILKNLRYVEDRSCGVYESYTEDPQFLVRKPWPTGWVYVSWFASSEKILKMKLYLDKGSGFYEKDSITFGIVASKKLSKYQSIIFIGHDTNVLRLDPGEVVSRFSLTDFQLMKIGGLEIFLRSILSFIKKKKMSFVDILVFLRMLIKEIRKDGWSSVRDKILEYGFIKCVNFKADDFFYSLWIQENSLTEYDKLKIYKNIRNLSYKPLISVIIPVYNTEEKWLCKCIGSVKSQLYTNWEICISDDASTQPHVKNILDKYSKEDSRIKVIYRNKRGHISANSNSALGLAKGEFIAFLDHDDELTSDALYENVLLLNKYPEVDIIYSDEDKIGEDGKRFSPFFKPDWSPDTLLSHMYTCHLGLYCTELVKEVGGFRKGFEGSQDYDLLLRLTEKTNKIFHIPKILYHWRAIAGSASLDIDAKIYPYEAGIKAIREAMERREKDGWIESIPNYPGHNRVHYLVKDKPLVSVIISILNPPELLYKCLDSIFSKEDYGNFEVIIINNLFLKEKLQNLIKRSKKLKADRIKIVGLDNQFNHSRLYNSAIKMAEGKIVVFLNSCIEIVSDNWLEELVGYAIRQRIGAAGGKILNSGCVNIMNAGIILGLNECFGFSHKGFDKKSPGYFGRLLVNSNYLAVGGGCLVTKKELFEKVGGFDERLTLIFNEVDLCLKYYSRGLYNVILPHIEFKYNGVKGSSYENNFGEHDGQKEEIEILKNRWGKFLLRDPFYNPNLTLEREDFSIKLENLTNFISF